MSRRFNFRSEFFQSVVVIASGTVLAQLIGFALAPVISRLYSPEQMGEFAFYLRVVTLISVLGTARYELSLPLPHSDRDSFHLYKLALRIALVTTSIVLGFSLVYIVLKSFDPNAVFMGAAVTVGVFLLVFFNLGTNWAIRMKAFSSISFSKVASSLSMNGFRVIAGVFQPSTYILVLTYLISLALGSFYFAREFNKNNSAIRPISKKRMLALSRIYSEFPKVNLPHALMEALRDVLVAMIVVELFSEFVFGSFDHSMRMLRVPLILIGASISQVLFNRVSELSNKGQEILPIIRRSLFYLGLACIVPFTVIFFFGEELFAWVFGEEWRFSGYLSELMAPWMMVNFLSSPVSAVPLILGKQRQVFLIGLTSTVLYLIGFGLIPKLIGNDPNVIEWTFGFVTGTQMIVTGYAIYFILKIAREADERLAVKRS